MERIETNKALKTVVNYKIDDVGISGLPVKLDLYNETANTWYNGATWVASKPSSLNMTDDGAKFNGRYYYNWTPNLDGYYVAYSYCTSGGYEFELEQDYEAVKLMSNLESISGTTNTINSNVISIESKVDIIDANVDTICADIFGNVDPQLDLLETLIRSFADIGSITASVLSGDVYDNNVVIKDIDVSNNVVYVVYKNSEGKLKVVEKPFSQGIIIASGVNE